MKIAAVNALAELAREDVPDDVVAAYQGSRPRFGPSYIIPVPFDPRLLASVSAAVAKAAIETGVAGHIITDIEGYKRELSARRDPIASTLRGIYERVRRQPKRIVFAEGEEEQVMRAAVSYVNQGLGTAILVGRDERIKETAKAAGMDIERPGIEIINARLSSRNSAYADYLYEKLQRKGYLTRDCHRLINNDRNHFAACMVALGDADGMVTGVTRNYATGLDDVRRVVDSKPGHRVVGVSIALCRGRTVFIADTAVHEKPTADELADIAVEAAGMARRMGYVPRVALTAFSTFGHMGGETSARIQEAVRILHTRHVDFEFDGEMSADVALNPKLMEQYPFIRLSGPANVIVTPDNHSASIAANMLQELGGATIIGPLLVGLDKPAQIVSIGAKDSDIVNMAAIAAYNATN
jgi:malate dehydrogenase (oxaloacetate-decarboxylating)(NADP+)